MAWRGKRSEAFKRKLRAALNRPEVREKLRAAAKATWAKPEVREKLRAALNRRLAWCPPELIEDYRTLVKHLGARAARASIEAQMRRRPAHTKLEAA